MAVARDAGELRRWLYDLRDTAIAATGPCRPAPGWQRDASDRYLDFWRICTRPPEPAPGGGRLWRIVPGQPPRTLALDEPPALVELASAGDALLARGEVKAALAAYQLAHDQAPALALPLVRAGTCRLKLGDAPGAVKELRRAAGCPGAGPDVLDLLGDALLAARDPGRAAGVYEQAAGLENSSASRWIKAARALERAGLATAARNAARRARERDPQNREARDLAARLGAL